MPEAGHEHSAGANLSTVGAEVRAEAGMSRRSSIQPDSGGGGVDDGFSS